VSELRGSGEALARVGVSACLLGERVRYDGGHKEHPLLRGGLAPWITLVAVCPEAELGLGTPREPIQLVRRVVKNADAQVGDEQTGREGIALLAPGSGLDHTESMARFAQERVAQLVVQGLDGYVLKSRSPSCGLAVEVHTPRGLLPRAARGRFAEVLAQELPDLPLCEEHDLDQDARRERFLHRVRAHAWLRQSSHPDREALLAFHEEQRAHLDAGAFEELRASLLQELDPARYRRGLLGALARES
jgi:uncharacterized protein YbbK (DUF523 family)